MVAFSNYFFDTTQGHSQINGCTVRNVYIKEAFDTGVRYDFKGNFDLEGLERGIEEVGPNNVPYIVATITSNSAGGQPVSLANLKSDVQHREEIRYSGGHGLRTLCRKRLFHQAA